jgi:peptidylprolyl isomerase
MRRRLAAACVAVLTLPGLAACGSDSPADSGSDIEGLTVSGSFGEEPEIETDELDVDQVETSVVVEGDGEELASDGAALYRFVIANARTGEVVASNYQDENPRRLVVAEEAEVVASAVTGETIGSRVALAMPVRELLGEEGAPQVGLGPDDDLVMVIDLVDVAQTPLAGPEGEEVDPPRWAPGLVEEDGDVTALDFSESPRRPRGGFHVIPLVEGEGPEVKEDDPITVDYLGAVWNRGDRPFDSSFERGEPATFQLSKGSLIDGWVRGLDGVKAGSRVMLVIPPRLGYGEQGSGEDIPGDATLVFVIDVLQVGL